jgi:hypothetical protein
MEPALFQSLPPLANSMALIALIEISLLLFISGRKYLKPVSIVIVALVGGVVGEWISVAVAPGSALAFVLAGLAGGALLGKFLRPIGVGLALAFLGYTISTNIVGFPFIEYVAALDLLAYGILLTDLAPTLVSTLLASSIVLLSILWTGVPAPAAFVLASAIGASGLMATLLPPRLMKSNHPFFAS